MPFSSRSCCLAGSLAIVLLAACESTPAPEPEPDVPCGASFPTAPEGAGDIVYVAAQCLEAEAIGSKAHPYLRIADALEHAEDGATILVSAGEYKERLVLARPVTIVGSSNPADPEDATLSLAVGEAEEDTAITVSSAGVTVIGVRIEGARGAGVLVDGGTLTLAGSVVSGTQPGSDGAAATGVLVRANGSLTLQGSRVTGTSGSGVVVQGAAAAISGSEVRDSLGAGIVLDRAVGAVTVSDSTVSGSVGTGIRVQSSRALIEKSTVSGTAGDENDAAEGILSLEGSSPDDGSGQGFADLTVRDSVISGNGRTGILCGSGTRTVVIQGNTIADNGLPGTEVFKYVAGLWLQSGVGSDPSSEISGNTVSGNKLAGIFMFGDTGGIPVVENSVSGTLTAVAFGVLMGDGISLIGGASARLEGNEVSQNGRFGIMVESAPAAGTEITGNSIENNAEYGVVLQNQTETIAVDSNTFNGNPSGDVADVPAGTYGNPDRPLPL